MPFAVMDPGIEGKRNGGQMKGRTDGWIDAFGRTDCEKLVIQGSHMVGDTLCPAWSDQVK